MPKGAKAAPPQQSKLEEMWGKKKLVSAKDDDKMETEDVSPKRTKDLGAPRPLSAIMIPKQAPQVLSGNNLPKLQAVNVQLLYPSPR